MPRLRAPDHLFFATLSFQRLATPSMHAISGAFEMCFIAAGDVREII